MTARFSLLFPLLENELPFLASLVEVISLPLLAFSPVLAAPLLAAPLLLESLLLPMFALPPLLLEAFSLPPAISPLVAVELAPLPAIWNAITPPKGPAPLGLATFRRHTLDMPPMEPWQVVPAGIATLRGYMDISLCPRCVDGSVGEATHMIRIDVGRSFPKQVAKQAAATTTLAVLWAVIALWTRGNISVSSRDLCHHFCLGALRKLPGSRRINDGSHGASPILVTMSIRITTP